MSTLLDSYAITNESLEGFFSNSLGKKALGQSFTVQEADDGKILDYCEFALYKTGSPTGNIVARLYTHTGTFGETGIPNGNVLAESDPVDITSLGTSSQRITFTFSDAQRIALNAGNYFMVIYYSGAGAVNKLLMDLDNTFPGHAGNYAYLLTQGWSFDAGIDAIFYVYGADAEPETQVSQGNFFLVL
jgi:hypothetical protein